MAGGLSTMSGIAYRIWRGWREFLFTLRYKRVEMHKIKGGGYVGVLIPRWGKHPIYSPKFIAKGSVTDWVMRAKYEGFK